MAWGCQSHCNILLQKKGEKILFYNWVACALAKLTKSGYIYICKASTMALSGCGGLLRNGKERTR